MLGIILNLILVALGTLALSAGISFFVQERGAGYIRGYTLLFGAAAFLICAGYAVMGFLPDARRAFIPRLAGLYGIDVFLLMEVSFLTMELRKRQGFRAVIIGCFALYVLLDLIIFGRPSALNYVRYDFHTAFETVDTPSHLFHYGYILAVGITLMTLGVQWYKSKKVKRDRQFALELILANFVVLFAAIPDIFKGAFSQKYPTFTYSAAFAFVYFSYWVAVKHHLMFTPTVRNVSQEIFHSVDVPILIFDLDGNASLFNPCAENALRIEGKPTLRSIFTLSDVETLRLLARAKRGEGGKIAAKVKATGAECTLSCAIRLDNAGEPFCIIGTVLFLCGECGV